MLCSTSSLHYNIDELALVNERPLPRHVAIIMDGNRRWARKKKILDRISLPLTGHSAGANTLTKIVEAASDLGIQVLTVFGFSTENWGRPQAEIDVILNLLQSYLVDNRQKMIEEGVRFQVIGDLTPFSQQLKNTIQETIDATRQGSKMDLVVALNYGGRDEIKRAIRKIVEQAVQPEAITEALISQYLDTAPFGDPDLLIRPSGEKRISNFLLWQMAYTEVYMTDTLWPDFNARDLLNAVLDFQKRQRRIGK